MTRRAPPVAEVPEEDKDRTMIVISKEIRALLDELARTLGIGVSAIISLAIVHFFATSETFRMLKEIRADKRRKDKDKEAA